MEWEVFWTVKVRRLQLSRKWGLLYYRGCCYLESEEYMMFCTVEAASFLEYEVWCTLEPVSYLEYEVCCTKEAAAIWNMRSDVLKFYDVLYNKDCYYLKCEAIWSAVLLRLDQYDMWVLFGLLYYWGCNYLEYEAYLVCCTVEIAPLFYDMWGLFGVLYCWGFNYLEYEA